ncbi:MAG: hypothetical protein ACO3PY_06115 [Pontimonas sp.]|jgi:hypothetical protein
MSTAYDNIIRIAGQPCPPGHNAKVWSRYQQICKDTRLRLIDPALLPDSYSALYELTKLSGDRIRRMVELDAIRPDLSCREIREIRLTGKVWIKVEL